MEEIVGHIERITFQNTENGFTVARLKESHKKDLTVVIGTMSTVQVGETVRCKGKWKNDINYGLQFVVDSYLVEKPSSIYGIKKYLGSGLIKGIGPVFAERIVDYLGVQTLDVIDREPEALLSIEGIGDKRLESIQLCWEEQKAVREVMVFLQSHGISPTYAQKVYKTYKEKSLEVIKANPYQLAKDIWGIGFKTADQTAQKLGIKRDAVMRIDAGVEYSLSQLSNDGHTCYPIDEFLELTHKLLEVEANLIAQRLDTITKEERIFIGPLVVKGQTRACIWLKALFECEKGIKRELERLSNATANCSPAEFNATLQWAEKTLNMTLADNQKLAAINSLKYKNHIITGGPGTGKSTIIKIILLIFHQLTTKILLAAPTGRAAKRMSEITKVEASTIHSLLEFDFAINGFRRNRENPLDCDLVIVDEASMIDTVLMYSLLKALPDRTRLILVGDVDQLPSVGPGNVLKDLINAKTFLESTALTQIFRQAANSKIILSAHQINKGYFPDIRVDASSDFFFIAEENAENIATTIVDLVQTRLPNKYGFDSIEDIQVISPMNRSVIGTRNLNQLLQKKLNASNEPLIKTGRTFHLHDKVMQIRNNYDQEIFNGDIGQIVSIDRVNHLLKVDYDTHIVSYDFADVDQLMLAYAVSVHKYQGSECPCIIMPIHTMHYMMLYRNLIYTGITRGKQLVVLIGSKKALSIAVKNDKVATRFSGLQEILRV